MKENQGNNNCVELGQILLNLKDESDHKSWTGNRFADFIIATLAFCGLIFIAGLIGGGIKI